MRAARAVATPMRGQHACAGAAACLGRRRATASCACEGCRLGERDHGGEYIVSVCVAEVSTHRLACYERAAWGVSTAVTCGKGTQARGHVRLEVV